MSRKMIDYQVENGKVKSIDGYEVSDTLVPGDKSIAITKNEAGETTIIAKSLLKYKSYSKRITIKAGTYHAGDSILIDEYIPYDEGYKGALFVGFRTGNDIVEKIAGTNMLVYKQMLVGASPTQYMVAKVIVLNDITLQSNITYDFNLYYTILTSI